MSSPEAAGHGGHRFGVEGLGLGFRVYRVYRVYRVCWVYRV